MIKPFLRWAGGKQLFIDKIKVFVPEEYNTYFEPFIGGGALFFNLSPQKAVIADLNKELINCYLSIKTNPTLVYDYLINHSKQNTQEYYYTIRKQFNILKNDSIAQAARFIYLNWTSFNGIYRENLKGEYNVPYGFKKNALLLTYDEILNYSKILSKTKIINCSYEKIESSVLKNDLVYLDPPYPPLNNSSNFTHYNKERFSEKDQIDLFNFACRLSIKEAKVIVTNADIPLIRDRYKKWNIQSLDVRRFISCKKEKHLVSELIITNY